MKFADGEQIIHVSGSPFDVRRCLDSHDIRNVTARVCGTDSNCVVVVVAPEVAVSAAELIAEHRGDRRWVTA